MLAISSNVLNQSPNNCTAFCVLSQSSVVLGFANGTLCKFNESDDHYDVVESVGCSESIESLAYSSSTSCLVVLSGGKLFKSPVNSLVKISPLMDDILPSQHICWFGFVSEKQRVNLMALDKGSALTGAIQLATSVFRLRTTERDEKFTSLFLSSSLLISTWSFSLQTFVLRLKIPCSGSSVTSGFSFPSSMNICPFTPLALTVYSKSIGLLRLTEALSNANHNRTLLKISLSPHLFCKCREIIKRKTDSIHQITWLSTPSHSVALAIDRKLYLCRYQSDPLTLTLHRSIRLFEDPLTGLVNARLHCVGIFELSPWLIAVSNGSCAVYRDFTLDHFHSFPNDLSIIHSSFFCQTDNILTKLPSELIQPVTKLMDQRSFPLTFSTGKSLIYLCCNGPSVLTTLLSIQERHVSEQIRTYCLQFRFNKALDLLSHHSSCSLNNWLTSLAHVTLSHRQQSQKSFQSVSVDSSLVNSLLLLLYDSQKDPSIAARSISLLLILSIVARASQVDLSFSINSLLSELNPSKLCQQWLSILFKKDSGENLPPPKDLILQLQTNLLPTNESVPLELLLKLICHARLKQSLVDDCFQISQCLDDCQLNASTFLTLVTTCIQSSLLKSNRSTWLLRHLWFPCALLFQHKNKTPLWSHVFSLISAANIEPNTEIQFTKLQFNQPMIRATDEWSNLIRMIQHCLLLQHHWNKERLISLILPALLFFKANLQSPMVSLCLVLSVLPLEDCGILWELERELIQEENQLCWIVILELLRREKTRELRDCGWSLFVKGTSWHSSVKLDPNDIVTLFFESIHPPEQSEESPLLTDVLMIWFCRQQRWKEAIQHFKGISMHSHHALMLLQNVKDDTGDFLEEILELIEGEKDGLTLMRIIVQRQLPVSQKMSLRIRQKLCGFVKKWEDFETLESFLLLTEPSFTDLIETIGDSFLNKAIQMERMTDVALLEEFSTCFVCCRAVMNETSSSESLCLLRDETLGWSDLTIPHTQQKNDSEKYSNEWLSIAHEQCLYTRKRF